jgi:ABC-type polysaccharide/polyol phosphate export permease
MYIRELALVTKRWRDWLPLAWSDFSMPYRRTFIGPLWQAIQAAVWVAGLYAIFHSTESNTTDNYVVYVASGVVIFGFISTTLTSAPDLYLRSANTLLNINISPIFFVFRFTAYNAIKFVCQLPVVFIAVYLFGSGFTVNTLWLIPGLLLLLITGLWMTLLLATIGARYVDLKYAMTSVARILFFVSPIFWGVSDGGLRNYIASYNPITYFIGIIRDPIMSSAPSMHTWTVVLVINLIGIFITWALFTRSRKTIPLWL